MLSFLDTHNIFSEYQFGFHKGRSTELAIHSLVEQYYEAIDGDNFMVGIFLDFSRAFDTISQKSL